MARIIINSDDYGLNASTNDAIIFAFQNQLISSTTTLVNYPEGLIDGQAKLQKNNIKLSSVGIHLNLTTGKPLTEAISKNIHFCENGFFHSRAREKPILFLNKKSQVDVQLELEAQILRFIEIMGRVPAHIDGHHHIHTEYAIFKIIAGLAKKYDVRCMRKTRNLGIGRLRIDKRIYKWVLNFLIDTNFTSTNFFGSLTDLDGHVLDPSKTYEIMVHALLVKDAPGIVFDDDGIEMKVKIDMYLPNDIEKMTYTDLIRVDN